MNRTCKITMTEEVDEFLTMKLVHNDYESRYEIWADEGNGYFKVYTHDADMESAINQFNNMVGIEQAKRSEGEQ